MVNELFGVVSGLGMGLLTFDWNQVALLDSPLVVPFWVQMNWMAGFVAFGWILTPILYYSNVIHCHPRVTSRRLTVIFIL